MHCDTQASTHPAAECYFYKPGYWEQDLYTIPAEALIVTLISQQKPPSSPRWPFDKESANEFRNPSRQPGLFAATLGAASLVPLTASILDTNPKFPAFTHIRGIIHSHLWTEFFTSSAKIYFGRKRPFYDTVERRGEARRDDKLSFFSGHASHAFAFATYSSQLAFAELKSEPLAWTYASLLNGTATWVASSRAVDNQHNWSDVIAGAVVGSTVGYFMHQRVHNVSQWPVQVTLAPQVIRIDLKLNPR